MDLSVNLKLRSGSEKYRTDGRTSATEFSSRAYDVAVFNLTDYEHLQIALSSALIAHYIPYLDT